MPLNWIKARYPFQSFLRTVIKAELPSPLSLRSFPNVVISATLDNLLAMTLKPDFGPNGCNFPPLPVIRSRAIELQVFTHRSFFARPTHIFEDHPDDLSPDNEKFEHLGDAVLGLSVTNLMMQMYPGLRVGPSTKIRALIVGNATLAEISLKYRLPDRLRLHPAQAITLRASTHIQADVLESFIGGLYHEQGLDAVKAWLDPLFKPYARAAYELVRRQHGLPALPTPAASPRSSPTGHADTNNLAPTHTVGHLALFNQHLQKSDRQVEWIYSDQNDLSENGESTEPEVMRGTKVTPVWYVKVLVDGEFYGKGRGNTKKAARNEAAKLGLEKMGIFVCANNQLSAK
ncbi:putative ribonuclease-III-like protein [Lyophyllum shimeji]|uniref:Ribonuclease-III-like protein n=1 Tax=Lyophyllum shimeji TaxID=47721 RepID=A0A9P3UK49_LYOSH|nr:putative ribonuclease-III-like protein [Lyophyllum shimeji]